MMIKMEDVLEIIIQHKSESGSDHVINELREILDEIAALPSPAEVERWATWFENEPVDVFDSKEEALDHVEVYHNPDKVAVVRVFIRKDEVSNG